MSDNNNLNKIIKELKSIESNLEKVLELSGTNQRVREMKKEILELGWNGIYSKYHPEINIHDSARNELFAMYKYVYELMQEKGEI